MKIFAVILNYRGLKNTIESVDSVLSSRLPINCVLKVIVVDNNSLDESVEKLKSLKNIHLIVNSENLGYSGGNNVGIKYALKNKADYVLILNNDIVLEQDAIKCFLDSTKKGDILSPKIYFSPGFEFHKKRYKKNELGNVIWFAGGTIDWQNVIGKHLGVDEVDRGQFKKGKLIDFATGACFFCRASIFEEIGLLDEKYFLYMEDLDFCLRATKANLKVYFEPKAKAWHKNAASTGGSGSHLQDYYITRNRLLFAFKYSSVKTKLAVLRQITLASRNMVKRKALIDFLTMNFGKQSN